MTEYFTSDHFELLNKWKNQRRDDTDPNQNAAYEELSRAYAITEKWAHKVRSLKFPNGKVSVRKRPTSQANKFFPYNWARIYPDQDSPKELAYTVGLGAEEGFVVKIDTVQANQSLRNKYEVLRKVTGNESPIIAVMPASDGLQLTLDELAEWTVNQFDAFEYTYDAAVEKLGILESKAKSEPAVDNDGNDEPLSFNDEPAINRIYYGPPGTGKTYAILQELEDNYTSQAQSMAPEDWQRGQIANQVPNWPWWKVLVAALHDLDAPTDVAGLIKHPFTTARAAGANIVHQTIWGVLQGHATPDSTTVKVAKRHAPGVFDKTEDSKWHLAGDWKEECDDVLAWVDQLKKGPADTGEIIERYAFVTFHQSYGYEEFVEGLRPVLDVDEVSYTIVEGAFLRLCHKASADPAHRYAMVIDEINRGNISKIFGELITLIEADKRSGCANEITVSLPYSGNAFSVPRNVDIIGSMNTADRSLALVDTALRRRFEFTAVMPEPATLTGVAVQTPDGSSIDLQAMLSAMNRRIEALFDRDHTIGHAFFLPLKDVPEVDRFDALKGIFIKKIIPLLEEFFFDDWQKISLVLGDNQKNEATTRFIATANPDQDLADLFGSNHDLVPEDLRPQRSLNMAAFDTPAAYVGIYDSTTLSGPSQP
jgi:5-methylcytosine-specific restriction protein B